ncbi:DMT family transporter [Stappia sp. TSB10P1A]|uniref:DMT family transporter n=1 Tax=Stappia sp. TSB10P1A TaxID=2003585 RepID=UPI00164388DA|nr:DMT family transporter [Stappia sp. TSB10P1A]
MSWKNWVLLVVLALVWGATFPFGKIALGEIPPFVLAFLRVLLAALVLHAVLRIYGLAFPRDRSTLGAFLLMGLLNNAIPFSLILWGQTGISASLASILNATTPIFTVLVASLAFRQEVLRAHRVAGIVVGFAGVALLLLPGLEAGALAGLAGEPAWAQFLCLGAALSYAFAAAFARRFRGVPVMVAATGQLTGSSLLLLPLALWQASASPGGWSPAMAGPAAWASVVALGTACTAFAYLIYFRLLSEGGATNASLVTLLIPVSATLISALLLGEALSGLQLAGMGVLLAGLVLLDGRVLAVFGSSRRPAGSDPR